MPGDARLDVPAADRSAGTDGGGPETASTPPPVPGGPDQPVPADAGPHPFLHPLFTDHVVLQRDAHTPIWGWSNPGDVVTVRIADRSFTATADAYGRWLTRIGPFAAGGPFALEISGPAAVTLQDVYFGDVWLCSGQSNMELNVSWPILDAAAVLASSSSDRLRLYALNDTSLKEPRQTILDPTAHGNGVWKVAGPDSLPGFSAVCYFMGRDLQRTLDVPIGLIESAFGGSSIQWWISAERLDAVEDFRAGLDAYPARVLQPGQTAITTLYNAMIAPLLPYGLKGIAWYQGESNVADGRQYGRLLPILIDDWRSRFRMGKLPFLIAQLANFHPGHPIQTEPVEDSGWALVREAQLETALGDDRVGLAVIADVGETEEIHPPDKQDVGHRLALSALHVAYSQDGVFSGPIYKSMSVEGDRIRVLFDDVGSGLMVGKKDGSNLDPVQEVPAGPLRGFAIAGADRSWQAGDAIIDGGAVVVSSPLVPNPLAVRYGWADNPTCNLYNREGLMASPFRTDPDYGLSVVDGAGSGPYAAGQKVTVLAQPPAGQRFVKWVGDSAVLDDATKGQATVTMPARYVSIRAAYSD